VVGLKKLAQRSNVFPWLRKKLGENEKMEKTNSQRKKPGFGGIVNEDELTGNTFKRRTVGKGGTEKAE